MSWNDDQEKKEKWRNEYMTVGPYPFPHQRDAACNSLATSGEWFMHSSDVHRQTGHYFAIMARSVKVDDGEL